MEKAAHFMTKIRWKNDSRKRRKTKSYKKSHSHLHKAQKYHETITEDEHKSHITDHGRIKTDTPEGLIETKEVVNPGILHEILSVKEETRTE